jgi:hypothetical protein
MTDTRQDTKQTEQAAMRSPAQAAADAGRQGAEAVQQGGRAAGEALRRGGEFTVEATRRGGEAGAETMHRAGDATVETLRRGAQDVAESQRRFVQDAAERFEEVSRKVAQAVQGTTEDVRTLMVLPNAAKGGLQDLQQSVTGLVEGVVQTNLRATQELFRLANPSAFVELQQRFMREYLDTLLQGSATLIRAVRRTADQTLRPLEEQIEQRQHARRGEQSYQNAAE